MTLRSTLKALTLSLLACSPAVAAHAQAPESSARKPYLSTGIDGYILSTTLKQKAGESTNFSTPRFTGFLHLGLNINYDFSKNFGIYTGVNIKNIGFIEKYDNPDSTAKRRVYTFGIPLGLKIGNVKYGSYLIVGGGIDFPFNYKEKGFIDRGNKTKFNEWFSSRTPAAMPYVFIGAHLRPLMAVKLQYYPTNFMNPDFETTLNGATVKPYAGYDVKLIMLTFGFDINYKPKN